MPINHTLRFESRIIFAALLAVLFLAGCQTAPPIVEPPPIGAPTYRSSTGWICGERTALVAQLKTKYAQQPKSRQRRSAGGPYGDEWHLVDPGDDTRGVTCLMWFGEHWQDIGPQDEETAS